MTRIKICGVTGVDPAIAAALAGADFVGLVFAPSRRQITVEKALEISQALRLAKPRPLIAGVFVNHSIKEINRIANKCHIDWVQLSGNEDWQSCREIERPIIKAIHIYDDISEAEVLRTAEQGYRIIGRDRLIFLLDTGVKNAYGGTGIPFNWDVAGAIIARYPVIMAGGLNPENVGSLIERLAPWGVDVSTGVETNGRKDIEKIKTFVLTVRSAQKE